MKDLDPDHVHRLLVRGTNWVGDAIMSIPALKEIRRIFHNARISLLVRPWVKDVYAAADFVDEILIYEKPGRHQTWPGMRRLAVELRPHRFEATILFQNALEAALISFWALIPIRVGYTRDARGLFLSRPVRIDPGVLKVHQVHYYLGILSGAGLLPPRLWECSGYSVPSTAIGVCAADAQQAANILEAHGISRGELVVGLNPGASYGSAKRWPADRFAAVADALARQVSARIVIFGAPSELQIAQEVAAHMQCEPVLLAGKTTLGQLMGLIRKCSLFITNDSGPMHLAAALDVPQLAIFGSTSETATGPLSARATVITNQVDCNPCFLRDCPTDFRCMLGIPVERVMAAALAKLSEMDWGGKGSD